MNSPFLDTSYPIALVMENDAFHAKATRTAEQIVAQRTPVVTTRAVLMELGNSLSRLPHRAKAIQLLQYFEEDPLIKIVPVTEELYAKAFKLYSERPDKEWSLVDCISFIVMQERGLTDALTSDEHFRQAGFRVLMREP